VNLKHKSDADLAIRQFIAMGRTQYGKVIHKFQINAEGEFKSKELTEFLRELSVNILISIPHMHQQNGHAECFIRTIMDKSQAIRLESCAPQSWWEFAVDCAIHVYNHTLIQHYNWKTPVENLTHTKPDVTHFHVFGCGAYIFLPEEVHHNKLNTKSELMTFIGYPQALKGISL
jgi:transposase InsO family protein